MIQQMEKALDEVEAKVIRKFDRLRTAHSKRQTNHMSIGNLLATHAFDYIVLRVNLA